MAFLRKLVQSHSFHFPLSRLFPRFLSAVPSSKPLSIISTGSFDILRTGNCYYLDKTHFIPKIEALGAPAILSLRPRRFGKTLFLSTLSSYYDVKNRERFKQLFQDLYIGKNPTPLASEFLVLKLNFSGLRTNGLYEIFEVNFHKTLNTSMKKFMSRYEQELGNHHFRVAGEKDALVNFRMLLDAVELSDKKLYIYIDEYDGSMNEALKNKTLFQALTNHHKNEGDSKIALMENSFKQFFSILKTACDEGIARVFLTGVTPVIMAEFTSGFNISEDLTLEEEFWDLYGFKKSEVEFLLDKAFGNNLSDNIKKEIMSWLKEENNGYFFHRNQPEGIFNTARVMYCIRKLMKQKKKLDDSWDSSVILNTLLNFPPDPQTLPAQTTLDLIVNNPLGKSILTEALSRSPLNSTDGIEQRFRLTNIRELVTDRTPLLSFMFYTGAITYQPNTSPASLQHNFRIPNRVAEREFITEALKIYDWQKEDLIPVRDSLQILEAKYDIEPLCRFIEGVLLKPLKDNSIKHSNEEALKQAFMDTLILTIRADIEPEFQVYSQSSNFGGKAIDLVKTSTGKMIAIEFDNIKMENVKLDGARGSWQKATEVSRSLLEKSEDEILSLEIKDIYRPNQKTVREALESKIKNKSNEYLDSLKKQHNVELSCMFIVLRVGLHRLISRRVYCVDE
ncbi:15393_t:CDS:2 [Funneliformis geosporum]|uniref:15393_t:CDS:1 n=1 Tax=Funneliformis geosporum TaxID=1117311 RepID=A0A9W4SXM1_9GLOM|nr:15393_t:CDS:2 [Funneliformis geosporum]